MRTVQRRGKTPLAHWSVPPAWQGDTAVILGGGPSILSLDWQRLPHRLHGCRTITINNSWELAPAADVLYFCDPAWWRMHPRATRFCGTWRITLNGDPRLLWGTQLPPPGVEGIHSLLPRVGPGLSHDATMLATGSRPGSINGTNSGYQAINLAYHFGAKRIILLGYDMHVTGGRSHWHVGHPGQGVQRTAELLADMLPQFATLKEPLEAAGVEVINATPESALLVWPYRPLADLVGHLA
jgi:hypothetical protein